MTASPAYATLVATVVSTVTLDGPWDFVTVVNVTGEAPVYFSVDGSTPTVAGAGFWPVAGAAGASATRASGNRIAAPAIKLISAGTPTVAVVGISDYEDFISTSGGGSGSSGSAVTSVVPGTGATNLGKAEDAAHASSDVGVMALAVRKAVAADLSAGATDGDYEPLQVDANGCLHVTSRSLSVATATLANVASSVTSVAILASNTAARGRTVVNDSVSATLYLKYGATASATSFTVPIAPGQTYEFPLPLYTGACDGIWTAAVGSARTTETS